MGVVSGYFPHTGRALSLFAQALEQVELVIRRLDSMRGIKSVLLGCDLNLCPSAYLDGATGGRVTNQFCEHGERESMILSFVAKHDLVFATTFDVSFYNEKGGRSENMTIRTAWGTTDVRTQIDFILSSP